MFWQATTTSGNAVPGSVIQNVNDPTSFNRSHPREAVPGDRDAADDARPRDPQGPPAGDRRRRARRPRPVERSRSRHPAPIARYELGGAAAFDWTPATATPEDDPATSAALLCVVKPITYRTNIVPAVSNARCAAVAVARKGARRHSPYFPRGTARAILAHMANGGSARGFACHAFSARRRRCGGNPPAVFVGESLHFRLYVDPALMPLPAAFAGDNALDALETEWSDVATMLQMPDGKITYYWYTPEHIATPAMTPRKADARRKRRWRSTRRCCPTRTS